MTLTGAELLRTALLGFQEHFQVVHRGERTTAPRASNRLP